MLRLVFILATAALLLLPTAIVAEGPRLPPPAQQVVDFRADVYPLLVEKCFRCHQGADASSGQRLDDRAALLEAASAEGVRFVAPGNSAVSRLIHVVAGLDEEMQMPAEGGKLTGAQIGILRAWIDQGLKWDDELLPPVRGADDHWAFQPLVRPAVPDDVAQDGSVNPIDAFVARKHAALKLRPAPPAEPRELARRLYLDLLGLPPTPDEIDAYLNDKAPDAYARLVDRLLASPQYGQRWGRHWLDVARWAESEGYESNHPRPFAWRYRDWVVESFNRDRPFDEFIVQQVAGDLLEPYTDENLIATGFLAAARISSNEEDKPLQRNDVLIDVVNATGNAFLGLTVQCAQCHDHKFDPLSQRDYYRLQGFFVQGQPGNLALEDPALVEAYNAQKPPEYDALFELKHVLFERGRQRRISEARARLSPEQVTALETPAEQRTERQAKLAREAKLTFEFTPNGIEKGIPDEDRKLYDEAKKRLAELEKEMPPVPQTWGYYSPTSPHAVRVLPQVGFYPLPYDEAQLVAARPCLLLRGEVHQRGAELKPDWPSLFRRGDASSAEHEPGGDLAGRGKSRLDLARWLASRDNPLTARVWVNRVWHYHFGRGLVTTPGNFGRKGARPSHPELLDWLAAEFIERGWRTKPLHRLIVTSRTYRMASEADKQNYEIDRDNVYLWRWLPRRIESETVRDAMLRATGELDAALGGPSVPAEEADTNMRRAIYQFQKRDDPPKMQALFNGPTQMTESCSARHVSTTPLSALYLLNNPFTIARSKALAVRLRREAGDDAERQVQRGFFLTVGRPPSANELRLSLEFLEKVEPQPDSNLTDPLEQYCLMLFNLNEFHYF